MDTNLLFAKFAQKLRHDGLRTTLKHSFRLFKSNHTEDDFDVRHGTDTGGSLPMWNFHIRSPNRIYAKNYEPTKEQDLEDAVKFLLEDLRNLTFIDIGCGKGKALLVAAGLGFKRVIGVEFVRELAEIARENLARKNIANAIVVVADAAEYRFPDTDMVVYLFNPFRKQVARQVVANLEESSSKKLYVIYNGPTCVSVFDACGFLTSLGQVPGKPNILVWKGTKEDRHAPSDGASAVAHSLVTRH